MAKSPLLVGTIYGLALAGVYSVIIVLSTPYIPPTTSLRLSTERNWPFFLAIPSGFGVMMGLRRHLEIRGRCSTKTGKAIGMSTSVLSSFFSLFSLSLVGCCGLLALWVSILLGTSAVVSLVEFSVPLTLIALAGMVTSILFMAHGAYNVDDGSRKMKSV